MSRINELNRLLAPPLVAILLASGMASTAFASNAPAPALGPTCEKEHGSPKDRPVPKGQLIRRGVIGSFAGVDENGNILVETQFGIVAIAPPEGFDATTIEEGSRIATLLDKEALPVEEGLPTATDTPFRIGSALSLKVIPTTVTRSHNRGVVLDQDGDTVEVVDEDGEVETFEVTGDGGVQVLPAGEGDTTEPPAGEGDTTEPPAGEGDTTEPPSGEGDTTEPPAGEGDTTDLGVKQEDIEAGTDAILLTQCAGPGAKAEIRSIQRADRIAERLDRIAARVLERDASRAAKIADLQQRREDRTQARLDRTSKNASPESRGKVDKARGKGSTQGECTEDDTGDCPEGKERGKPDDKGGGGSDKGGGKKK